MIKKILSILLFFGVLLVSIQSASALQTYVGVKILNLTDDPTSSCAGETGYGSQGRIRALSSILPDYPIYYELKNSSGSLISSGNISEGDYGMNETMYLPGTYDLTSGANYTLFFDIDAIRIYLPVSNYNDFEATLDDNYWTAGKVGEGSAYETNVYSEDSRCDLRYMNGYTSSRLFFISNNRSINLLSSCTTDSIDNNCDEEGLLGVKDGLSDFRIDDKYYNLYQPNVGNFQFAFTFN